MAREHPKKAIPTKKHLARMERERMQTRYILAGTIAVLSLVILLVIYGVIDLYLVKPNQAVARVENERISAREFTAVGRYMRSNLVQRYYEIEQFATMFGEDPSMQQYLQSSQSQIAMQLSPEVLGEQVLETLIEDRIIRQEAARLGITVTEEEVNQALEEAFGFFENDTPTPTAPVPTLPVSTLSPAQLALITPTPTIGPSPTPTATLETEAPEQTPEVVETGQPEPAEAAATPTPEEAEPAATATPAFTATPLPTATPYTREGFNTEYQRIIDSYSDNINFSEENFYWLFESQIYRQKVTDAVVGELPRNQEMIWIRRIQVSDEALISELFGRIASGEDFGAIAAEYSTDSYNWAGGDQGWLLPDEMDPAVLEAVQGFEIGQVTDPFQTESGWVIVQLLGREERTIESQRYDQIRIEKFQEWLDAQRGSKNIEIYDVWKDRVPTQPSIPTL